MKIDDTSFEDNGPSETKVEQNLYAATLNFRNLWRRKKKRDVKEIHVQIQSSSALLRAKSAIFFHARQKELQSFFIPATRRIMLTQ